MRRKHPKLPRSSPAEAGALPGAHTTNSSSPKGWLRSGRGESAPICSTRLLPSPVWVARLPSADGPSWLRFSLGVHLPMEHGLGTTLTQGKHPKKSSSSSPRHLISTCPPKSHPSPKLELGCTEQDGPTTAGWSRPKRYLPCYSRTIKSISSQSLRVPALDPLTAQPLGENKATRELHVRQFLLLCLCKWRTNEKRLFLSIHSVVSVCKLLSSCTFPVRLVAQGCRTQTVSPLSVTGSTIKKKKKGFVLAQMVEWSARRAVVRRMPVVPLTSFPPGEGHQQ